LGSASETLRLTTCLLITNSKLPPSAIHWLNISLLDYTDQIKTHARSCNLTAAPLYF